MTLFKISAGRFIRQLSTNHGYIHGILNPNPALLASSIRLRKMSRVVDAWANPLEGSLFKAVPEVGRLIFDLSKSPVDKGGLKKYSPTDYKEMAAGAGYDKVLISAWQRAGKECVTNEKILEYVREDPSLFIGVGTVDLEKPQEAVKTVEKCVKEYGFKGIRILPWLWNRPPTDRYYYPVFSKLVELDVPFCTQVGHTGPLCPSEPGRPIPYIDQVALDFPDLKIVCGHVGYPWTAEMVAVAWKHKNVYIDTSAHAPKFYPKELLQYMGSYGQDKVMFGTNFPQLMFDRCLKEAKELPLKLEIMEKFMWRNANDVFKLDMEDKAKL